MRVNYGPPDISGLEKRIENLQQKQWHQKWWGKIVIGVIIGIITLFISIILVNLFG